MEDEPSLCSEPLAVADALAVLLPGAPQTAHRHVALHAALAAGPDALLPPGWEQRCDLTRSGRAVLSSAAHVGASGGVRVFYIDHNARLTSWTDPRREPPRRHPERQEGYVLRFGLERWDEESGPEGQAGSGSASEAPTPSPELQALAGGVLPHSHERLLRRASLHLAAVLSALAAGAESSPAAYGRRGYELLLHRRCRLLQRLHIALRRQGEQPEFSLAAWDELHVACRRESATMRPLHSLKAMERALEALERHAALPLTEAYTTQWLLKTRTHLTRCSAALSSLYPLQLLDVPAAHGRSSIVSVLQRNLVALVRERLEAGESADGLEAEMPLHTLDRRPPLLGPALPTPRGRAGPLDGANAALPEALSALLRLGIARGELTDLLVALETMLSSSVDGRAPPPIEAVELIDELEMTAARELVRHGLSVAPSVSLGAVRKHPLVGLAAHAADMSSARAALLASGWIEASAAAALVVATLAQSAVATVRGVGPWEHDLHTLVTDPPPSEIARAVALAAEGTASGRPALPLHRPLFLDVSPRGLRQLLQLSGVVVARVLAADTPTSPADPALIYCCLGLLRLLKVHLHYVAVCRLPLAELHHELDDAETRIPDGASAELEDPAADAEPCLGLKHETLPTSADGDSAEPSPGAGSRAEAVSDDASDASGHDGCIALDELRRTLLRMACRGFRWIDGATGAPVGEYVTAEAAAVLEVGRHIFFPHSSGRQVLLLQLLASQAGETTAAAAVCPLANGAVCASASSSQLDGRVATHFSVRGSEAGAMASALIEPEECGSLAARVLAHVMMASFSRETNVSELLLPAAGASGDSSAGIPLFERLLDLLGEEVRVDKPAGAGRCNLDGSRHGPRDI